MSGSLLIPVQSLGSYHCLIPDNIALQELRVSVGFGKKRHKMTVMTICGIQDDLKASKLIHYIYVYEKVTAGISNDPKHMYMYILLKAILFAIYTFSNELAC